MYIYSSVGATSEESACAYCYQKKSTDYPECQKLPAGSTERETCFKKADGDLSLCLYNCAPGATKKATLPILLTAALIAGAVWSG